VREQRRPLALEDRPDVDRRGDARLGLNCPLRARLGLRGVVAVQLGTSSPAARSASQIFRQLEPFMVDRYTFAGIPVAAAAAWAARLACTWSGCWYAPASS